MQLFLSLILLLSLSTSALAASCSDNAIYLDGEVDRSLKKLVRKKGFKRVYDQSSAKYLATKTCDYKYKDCREERREYRFCMAESINRTTDAYARSHSMRVNRCGYLGSCEPGSYLDSCEIKLTNLETMDSKIYSSDAVNVFGVISWKRFNMPRCGKLGIE